MNLDREKARPVVAAYEAHIFQDGLDFKPQTRAFVPTKSRIFAMTALPIEQKTSNLLREMSLDYAFTKGYAPQAIKLGYENPNSVS